MTNQRIETQATPESPAILTQTIDTSSLNGFKFIPSSNGYVYNMPLLLSNITLSQSTLKSTVRNLLITDRSHQLTLHLAALNANTYSVIFVALSAEQSSTGLFQKNAQVQTFPLDPYKYTWDYTRGVLEIIFIILFSFLIAEEVFVLVFMIKKMKYYIEPNDWKKRHIGVGLGGRAWL